MSLKTVSVATAEANPVIYTNKNKTEQTMLCFFLFLLFFFWVISTEELNYYNTYDNNNQNERHIEEKKKKTQCLSLSLSFFFLCCFVVSIFASRTCRIGVQDSKQQKCFWVLMCYAYVFCLWFGSVSGKLNEWNQFFFLLFFLILVYNIISSALLLFI